MIPLEGALSRLPHGASFRFLDRLTALEPGKKVVATYLLRGDEGFFEGHFPGQPILPAVIMIEMLAQAAGVACQTDPVIPAMGDLRLTAVRAMKITGTAAPGETVLIEAEIAGRLGPLVQAKGRVSVGGLVIAEGQVTLAGGNRD